jgi:DNA-binding MarR family transcriptional regulator
MPTPSLIQTHQSTVGAFAAPPLCRPDHAASVASLPATLGELHKSLLGMVASDVPDLSARQLTVLLTLNVVPGPHTVRGLAATLNVSKPAITRAIDRLAEHGFVRRAVDPKDRRSVHVCMQAKGRAFLQVFHPSADRAAI